MITERDLKEAIAECEGTKNPNANTCIKLAAYYTILDNLYGQPTDRQETATFPRGYSMSDGFNSVDFLTNSELSEIIRQKGIDKAYRVIDELVETIAVLNPSLYQSFVRKLSDL